MAQIIKHRRGSIASLKGTTARNAELIVATGSISDLNGPFVFIGSPIAGDEGVAGAFNVVSKIYQGNSAPTLSAGTYGSTLDGTPFYSTGGKSLYALQNSNVGNTKFDLTGNIEGNTISGVTINDLQSTNITASYVSASFVGDASGLYNLSLTGITGLELNKITSGSATASISPNFGLSVNVDTSITGAFTVSGSNIYEFVTGEMQIGQMDYSAFFYTDISYAEMYASGEVYIDADNYVYVEVNNGESGLYLTQNSAELYTYTGDIQINAYNDGAAYSVNISGSNNVNITGSNVVNVYSQTIQEYATNNIEIGQYDGSANFYTSTDYSEMYANNEIFINTENSTSYINIEVNDGTSGVYMDTGSVALYAYDGASAYIWSDNFVYVTASLGVSVYANTSFTGSVNIDGNTSLTGALVVSNGSATFDQGLVAQNSNMLLTSGSNLIVQNNGYVASDFLQGNTQQWNYLALNGNGAYGAPDVELSSAGDISLFAEGGDVNVTGSLKVAGDVTVENDLYVSGNIYQTGSFYTQGNIVLSGSINIGNSLTGDTINFGGEVNSDILPTTGATYNLGASGQTWNEVHAEYYYGDGSHLTNISLTGITGLNKIVDGPVSASILEVGGFQVNTDSAITGALYVSSGITGDTIASTHQGDGTNFKVGDDVWIGDINIANTMQVAGQENVNEGYIQFGSHTGTTNTIGSNGTNLQLVSYNEIDLYGYNEIYLHGDNYDSYLDMYSGYAELYSDGDLYLQGASYMEISVNSGNLWISSYDNGILYLNNDGGEGDIYVGNNVNTLYVTTYNAFITGSNETYLGNESYNSYFYTENNYAEMFTQGNIYINANDYVNVEYNDGDSGLYLANDGDYSAELYSYVGGVALSSYNGYDVKINAFGGEGDIYMLNGGNQLHVDGNSTFTGSMHVSNGLVFVNEGVLAQNSDLTLTSGSNLRIEDNGHLYFGNNPCVDLYFDSNSGNLIMYNDCNAFSIQNNTSITGSLNVNGDVYVNNNDTLYTNNIYGNGGSDLYIQTDNSTLYLNSSYETYIDSNNYTSIGWSGETNYTYYEENGVYTYSTYIEQSVENNSGEYNYIYLENDGVYLQTAHYNGTGATYHNVWLDNTGSLNLQNINLKTDGDLQIGGNTSVTGALYVSGTTQLSGSVTTYGNLYVSGNLEVFGSSTSVNLESHTVNIGDNIILVNAYSPFQRYAGIAGFDSGSSSNSGSLLWDSLNNYWNFVDDAGNSSKVIGTSTGSLGSEISLTTNTIPVATSANTIGNSLLTDDGTVFAYNTNKFTITGDTGDTYIAGNFTIAGMGGLDSGINTSYVVFKNTNDKLGFVGTSDTTLESNALLGYNTSTGVLQFSSLLDGGTY
jgi:cytoskeletal protein CcmA (bactofilin family)